MLSYFKLYHLTETRVVYYCCNRTKCVLITYVFILTNEYPTKYFISNYYTLCSLYNLILLNICILFIILDLYE